MGFLQIPYKKRPKLVTPLSEWFRVNGVSRPLFAARSGIALTLINLIADGRKLPSLAQALRIEEMTANEVSVGTWEGTELMKVVRGQFLRVSTGG